MKILSIDPSSVHVGIAKLENKKLIESATYQVKSVDVIERMKELARYFQSFDEFYDIVLVEQPDTFVRQGLRGLLNVLPIQMLMMSIGVIVGTIGQKYPVEFVRVSDWKGNSGKNVTQMMVFRLTGKKLNTHESDAYMMAVEWLNHVRFKNSVRRGELKAKSSIQKDVNKTLKILE